MGDKTQDTGKSRHGYSKESLRQDPRYWQEQTWLLQRKFETRPKILARAEMATPKKGKKFETRPKILARADMATPKKGKKIETRPKILARADMATPKKEKSLRQ